MDTLDIAGITKKYGKKAALDNITLSVNAGELFFLLGPSGCGKTTLLRIVAGLIEPDSGSLLFRGRDFTREPVEKRNLGMVFQQFSLWPHMTIAENVAYGLTLRGDTRTDRDKKVRDALAMTGLGAHADKRPGALSGGEQQRAALARALVYRSDIILLDEPLSNLDAKLRKEMREEIRRIHQKLGVTMLYVTHDQEEASALASRMALLKQGHVVQVGTPQQIYETPATPFAAEFFGEANLMPGVISETGNGLTLVSTGPFAIKSKTEAVVRNGEKVVLLLRPQHATLSAEVNSGNRLNGIVENVEFQGAFERVRVDCQGLRLVVQRLPDGKTPVAGQSVVVGFDPAHVRVLPAENKMEIQA